MVIFDSVTLGKLIDDLYIYKTYKCILKRASPKYMQWRAQLMLRNAQEGIDSSVYEERRGLSTIKR